MKISQVTVEQIEAFLRLDYDDRNMLGVIMAAAREYIAGYTGLNAEEIDQHEDITIAFFVLCQEMYDNRQMTVQNDKENPTVKQILALHSKNLL